MSKMVKFLKKMHIFYEQAYQTLFNKHDSYKQGFIRKSLTSLDMQQFKIVFSLFCLTTYHKQMFEFSENDFDTLLTKCLKQTKNQQVSAENLKKELLSNVPLMVQDGLYFCFAHRSFQEYFSACYLVHNQDLPYEVFDAMGKRLFVDNVLSMTFDINQRLLEKKWILPKIRTILSKIQDGSSVDIRFKNMLSFYTGLHIWKSDNESLRISITNSDRINNINDIDFIIFLYRKYNIERQKLMDALNLIDKDAETINKEYGDIIDFNKLDKTQQQRLIELGADTLATHYINTLRELEQRIKDSLDGSQNDLDDLLFG